jgi:hypothetical protein
MVEVIHKSRSDTFLSRFLTESRNRLMTNNIVYSDKLVEINDDSILVRDYYYPFGNKRVNFGNVENIVVKKPSLLSGKYRYYGTGDFRTWFPPDNRTSRDKIFIIKIKKKWWRIGLTVENSQTVLNLIKDKCSVIDCSIE